MQEAGEPVSSNIARFSIIRLIIHDGIHGRNFALAGGGPALVGRGIREDQKWMGNKKILKATVTRLM
jgi:hypothetical protein